MEGKNNWQFKYQQSVHKKNLELIHAQSSKRIDNSPPFTLHLAKNKVASYQNLRKQELNDIDRKNQVILEALNEISNRRVSFTQIKTQTVFIPRINSLNFNFRSKVSEKIMMENEKILEKLRAKGATINKKKMDEEYRLSLQYKKNLTRRQFFDSPKNKQKKLPKIERLQVKNKNFKIESELKERKSKVNEKQSPKEDVVNLHIQNKETNNIELVGEKISNDKEPVIVPKENIEIEQTKKPEVIPIESKDPENKETIKSISSNRVSKSKPDPKEKSKNKENSKSRSSSSSSSSNSEKSSQKSKN